MIVVQKVMLVIPFPTGPSSALRGCQIAFSSPLRCDLAVAEPRVVICGDSHKQAIQRDGRDLEIEAVDPMIC